MLIRKPLRRSLNENRTKPEIENLIVNPTSLEKRKIKFLLLEAVHQSAIETLKKSGYENIEALKTSLEGDELAEKITDAHFVGIRSRTQLSESVFAAARKLQAVGCFCIGTNQADLNSALVRGIPVFNAPFSNTRSVAELVTGPICSSVRSRLALGLRLGFTAFRIDI